MSNDSNTTTLYFESTASGGTGAQAHGESGQTNQFLPFTSIGTTGLHANGAAQQLPLPTGHGLMTLGDMAEGDGAFPVMLGAGSTGGRQHATLPSLAGTAHGTNTAIGRGSAILPVLQGSGDALSGGLAHPPLDYPVSFPALIGDGRTGARASALLPLLIGSGKASPVIHVTGKGKFPVLHGSGLAHRSIEAAEGHGILPALMSLAGGSADGTAFLPALRGRAIAIDGTVAVRQTWVMNIENNAVTAYNNFEFKQFGRAFNHYWAAGIDGNLFKLGGDTDAGAPISWTFETGLSDLGSRALKGVLGIYLDGIYEHRLTFTLVTDRARYVYDHIVVGDPENHQTQRIPIGRGVRSVNIGLGLASVKGAYFECDSIMPEYVQSNRRM
jgi:hypothetical protein